jgi:hypothetical protein
MQLDCEVQMQVYKDINNDSGVRGYEIGADYITVWFDGTERSYTYSYASAGSSHVETMKNLAVAGDGLNAYINYNVKFKYVR